MFELVLIAVLLGNCAIRAKVCNLKPFLNVLVVHDAFLDFGDNKHLFDSAEAVNRYQVERDAMSLEELLLGWGTAPYLFWTNFPSFSASVDFVRGADMGSNVEAQGRGAMLAVTSALHGSVCSAAHCHMDKAKADFLA
ncbi:MAG: hypothetical protein FD135_3151 [Comamonadaceae bacterium]|nr:MAG: hypothetical protein FD135_3151 [Comamonadaceae bacterium]